MIVFTLGQKRSFGPADDQEQQPAPTLEIPCSEAGAVGSFDDTLALRKRLFLPEFIEMEKTNGLWVKKKSAEPESTILF
ncbi:hypothetical protein [Rhizobium sullae]|uniref:hypothetical protein n=1 Tax=Rhizobium sullae TaxID=50338 RepID=UPI00104A6A1C|nr:hypothetical protein [Rhizobium sullae]